MQSIALFRAVLSMIESVRKQFGERGKKRVLSLGLKLNCVSNAEWDLLHTRRISRDFVVEYVQNLGKDCSGLHVKIYKYTTLCLCYI